jgi:hypothetical protein
MYRHSLFTASEIDSSVTLQADMTISLLNDKGQNYAYHVAAGDNQELTE